MLESEGQESKPLSGVTRSVTSTVMYAVGERLGPGAGWAVAPMAPFAEELIRGVRDELKAMIGRHHEQVVTVAQAASGKDDDEFASLVSESDETVLLTARALSAAAGTAWPDKVYAIGRALADGLIAAKDGEPNIADLVLPAMADMERLHVSLLDLLAASEPQRTGMADWEAKPYTWQVPAPRGGHHDGPRWTMRQIASARPGISPVVRSLLGTLERHGLAAQNDNTAAAIAEFSKASEDDIRRRTLRGGGGRPTVPAAPKAMSSTELAGMLPEVSWSITDLGEVVLGYYREAGELHRRGAAPAGTE